jgi:hypothetical protein
VGTPEQNGTAEKFNRTIMEMARCTMYSNKAPLCLWAEAAADAVYIRKTIPPNQSKMCVLMIPRLNN